jgi:hypothetical protein
MIGTSDATVSAVVRPDGLSVSITITEKAGKDWSVRLVRITVVDGKTRVDTVHGCWDRPLTPRGTLTVIDTDPYPGHTCLYRLVDVARGTYDGDFDTSLLPDTGVDLGWGTGAPPCTYLGRTMLATTLLGRPALNSDMAAHDKVYHLCVDQDISIPPSVAVPRPPVAETSVVIPQPRDPDPVRCFPVVISAPQHPDWFQWGDLLSVGDLDREVVNKAHQTLDGRTVFGAAMMYLPSFSLTFLTRTFAQRDHLLSVLSIGSPILVRVTDTDHTIPEGYTYAALTQLTEERIVANHAEPLRKWSLSLSAIARPYFSQPPTTVRTLQDVFHDFPSLYALSTAKGTAGSVTSFTLTDIAQTPSFVLVRP